MAKRGDGYELGGTIQHVWATERDWVFGNLVVAVGLYRCVVVIRLTDWLTDQLGVRRAMFIDRWWDWSSTTWLDVGRCCSVVALVVFEEFAGYVATFELVELWEEYVEWFHLVDLLRLVALMRYWKLILRSKSTSRNGSTSLCPRIPLRREPSPICSTQLHSSNRLRFDLTTTPVTHWSKSGRPADHSDTRHQTN